MSILKVENINKSFKTLQVLQNVSLEVQPGERHVIIGPNGAGKTTLFNCITNVLPIDSGKIFLEGQEISNMPSSKLVHLGMSRTFQKKQLVRKFDSRRKSSSCFNSNETISLPNVSCVDKAYRPQKRNR